MSNFGEDIARLCSVDGCGKKHSSKGFCNTHDKRFRSTGTTDLKVNARPTDIPGENWRPIPEWEEFYQVSDHGRVYSSPRRSTLGGLLKPTVKADGHLKLDLFRPGAARRNVLVHHLVMLAFVGERPSGMVCCHNNGKPADNRLCNLRYDSQSENNLDKVRHGTDHNASRSHCKRGHEFTPENTYRSPSTPNQRCCRACKSALRKARNAR